MRTRTFPSLLIFLFTTVEENEGSKYDADEEQEQDAERMSTVTIEAAPSVLRFTC
jgi:hypothetical protein